jgi:mitogen-activated protein kinase 1/3
LALDTKLNHKVAIKKLHPVEDIVDAKRVLREIRILRLMDHENIVRLINVLYDTAIEGEELG